MKATPRPTRADVARRAFTLWHARACRPGGEVLDWLEAERQLFAEYHESIRSRKAIALLERIERRPLV